MRAYAAQFLADRWDERGLGGSIAFYASKTAWNWGDGMFWAWGEGPDSLPGTLAPATGPTAIVHALNGFEGDAYPLRADLTQALWLAVLLVAGVGLLRVPYRRETLLVAVSVLGSPPSPWCCRAVALPVRLRPARRRAGRARARARAAAGSRRGRPLSRSSR